MSKYIKISQDYMKELCEEFVKKVSELKMTDGKISYDKSLDTIDRKANVIFAEKAWYKMQLLIKEIDKEVGWHGIAHRGENDDYFISDIMVYPQEVTGATVTTDQKEYEEWLLSHDTDTFNNIRMQGHSHVNMGVTPSSTDETLYKDMLGMLDDTMFYIFMIWNKKGDKTIKIYDLAKNILFETKDCEVSVQNDGFGFDEFLKDAKSKVKERAAYTPNTPGNYNWSAWNALASQYRNNKTDNKSVKHRKYPK